MVIHRRWRLVRAGRLAAALLVLLAALLALVGGLSGALRAEGAGREEALPAYHVVQPGDTLWQISVRLGGPSTDPRRLAWTIQKHNGLASPVIFPGQILELPPF